MTDPELLWKLIALAAIAGNLLVLVRKVLGKPDDTTISNSPLKVQKQEEYMSRRECSQHNASFHFRLLNLEQRFEKQQDSIKIDISKLHEKINDYHSEIMRAIGRLEGP